jgi:heme-degrading monooxygenase HmoA
MIVRRWRATAADEKRYVTHFRRTVMPELRRLAGYRGALILRRRVEAAVEIEVLTFWTSMASIRRFAGDNTDRAVVEEEAKAGLRRFDSRVRHFDVVLNAPSRTNLPRNAPRR